MKSTSICGDSEIPPEKEHSLLLRAALDRFNRGSEEWQEDARMRAARCRDLVDLDVACHSGSINAAYHFINHGDWDETPYLQELFQLYVARGYIELNKIGQYNTGFGQFECLPLEAAVLLGNLSMVEQSLAMGAEIPKTLTRDWRGEVTDSPIQTLADLVGRCDRPAMRGSIRLVLQRVEAERKATQISAVMRDVLDKATSTPANCAGTEASYGPRRRVKSV